MIQTRTAFTAEIDNVNEAVKEIRDKIEAAGPLLTHSIGLIHAYSDFVESGVVDAVCKLFDFDVAGVTTIAAAADGADEFEILTLTVLTSDDTFFEAGLTEPLPGEDLDAVCAGYEKALASAIAHGAGSDARPALILSFAPLLMNAGGDFFAEAMNTASGGVPNFGTLAVDNTRDYAESRVLFNGEAFADRYAFVLVFGDIKPRFYLATLAPERVFRDRGVVTDVEDNQVKTINDISVEEYLLSLGMTRGEDGQLIGINSYPFIIDLNDGTEPVVRIMFATTPEGYAVCGGDVPRGSLLSVGAIDANSIVEATAKSASEMVSDGIGDVVIMYSCIGRYMEQGYEPKRELEAVIGEFAKAGSFPWTLTYSGGELCPVKAGSGVKNRFHNETFIACVF